MILSLHFLRFGFSIISLLGVLCSLDVIKIEQFIHATISSFFRFDYHQIEFVYSEKRSPRFFFIQSLVLCLCQCYVLNIITLHADRKFSKVNECRPIQLNYSTPSVRMLREGEIPISHSVRFQYLAIIIGASDLYSIRSISLRRSSKVF